jgi:hypothetical protein
MLLRTGTEDTISKVIRAHVIAVGFIFVVAAKTSPAHAITGATKLPATLAV